MFKNHYFLCLLVLVLVEIALSEWKIDVEDGQLTVPQLLEKYKYPYEEHKVTTEDGYYIVLHRILSRKKKATDDKAKVVYLNHGILSGSFNWILNGPNNSLGYLLADAGYDVWMVNNRGNGYSMNRSVATAENYWSFDLNEMGFYDTPASIDYILDVTSHTDLTFIGHSQGCTIYFVMCSQKPEYEHKINKFIALAPLLNLKYPSPLIKIASQLIEMDTFHVLDNFEAFDIAPYVRQVTDLCYYAAIDRICKLVYELIQGWTPRETPLEFLRVLFGHYPAGTSSKNVMQILRWTEKDDIGRYDYGPYLNIPHYLQPTPPIYDLGSANVPKYVLYGGRDNVISVASVEYGLTKLRNVKNATRIGKFSHNDFMHGVNIKKFVNNKILRILNDTY